MSPASSVTPGIWTLDLSLWPESWTLSYDDVWISIFHSCTQLLCIDDSCSMAALCTKWENRKSSDQLDKSLIHHRMLVRCLTCSTVGGLLVTSFPHSLINYWTGLLGVGLTYKRNKTTTGRQKYYKEGNNYHKQTKNNHEETQNRHKEAKMYYRWTQNNYKKAQNNY